jgi:hypothetical protein
VGEQLAEHCETLLHNLKDPGHPRFVGRIVNSRVDPRYVPVLLRDLRESAEVFLTTEDSSLNYVGHTLNKEGGAAATGPPMRLGVTLYIFEEDGEEASEGEDKERESASDRHTRGARAPARRRRRTSRGIA